MVNEEAEKFKEKGNAAFKDKDYEEAIKMYNKAITLDPDNAVYYSNRSGAWYSKGKFDSALADANRSIQHDVNFVKGYSRKGAAHLCLGEFDQAEKAYKEGLTKEPGNAACTKGMDDVKNARTRKPTQQASGSSGGGGGGGGAAGIFQMLMSKLQQGGRMQMYMLAMGGYFLFSQFTKQAFTSSRGSESSPTVDMDDVASPSTDATISRMFKNVDGQWVSYMHSDTKSDSMLLMLHRTSSSADVEFSSILPSLAPAGARLVAPDRPCHGFSPCPTSGEPKDSKWLLNLIRAEGRPEKLAVLAVGRDAITQALALAQKKREVQLVLMMKPKVLAPKRSSMANTEEVNSWLTEHGQGRSGQAAAAAVWWAANADQQDAVEPSFKKPSQSCQVTVVYAAGDEEDEDFVMSLDNQGVEVKTRRAGEDEAMADILTDEVRKALDEVADDTL